MLNEQGRFEEAIAVCRRALELDPAYALAHNSLGNALKDAGQIEAAITSYRRALELEPGRTAAHSNLLFSLHYLPRCDAETIFAEHCRWDQIHARPLAGTVAPRATDPDPDRRLRIGYVSPDFREHSVAQFFESVLENHDRTRVEVFCYACLPPADRVTARLRQQAAHWRIVHGLTDDRAAELMRADGIDIFVDLARHSAGNRLPIFARQPAPVQVSYLGYNDTTGMKAMHYRLTDAHADPPGATEHLHTEQLIRLPHGAWCFRPPSEAPPVSASPCLAAGATFGSFNALPKLNDTILSLWARLLWEVPGAHLLLKTHGFREPSAQARIRMVFEKVGVASERVEMCAAAPDITGHLAAYQRVDIALDTFPYHGTTTTCESAVDGRAGGHACGFQAREPRRRQLADQRGIAGADRQQSR